MGPCRGPRARTPPRPRPPSSPRNGAYEGPTTLTASTVTTFEEIAALASELTGRTIERVVMDHNEWVATQVAAGQQEFVARFTLGMYQAAHEGYFTGVDPLLGTLLGREPRTVRELLAQPTALDAPHRFKAPGSRAVPCPWHRKNLVCLASAGYVPQKMSSWIGRERMTIGFSGFIGAGSHDGPLLPPDAEPRSPEFRPVRLPLPERSRKRRRCPCGVPRSHRSRSHARGGGIPPPRQTQVWLRTHGTSAWTRASERLSP